MTTAPDRSLAGRLAELGKAARYAASMLRRRLVHTNLQVLYTCNFRCRICDFWKPDYAGLPQLARAQAEVLSDRLNVLGPQIVSIGGGEPLLHPDLEGIVRALARHHFPVMICNGWFVTPERARSLFAAGLYEVSVSVDYADPARHDGQRGHAGAFEQAFRALRALHENRTSPYQRVHLISVVMEDNLPDLEALIRRCRALGITFLVTLYSDARGSKECRAVARDASAALLALKAKYPEFVALRGYLGNFSRAIAERGVGPCYAGRNLCNIDCQGNVSLCIDRRDDVVGNLLTDDARVIEERLRAKHRANDCRGCWTSCRGSIETFLYGKERLANLWDYCRMVRPVPLDEVPGSRFQVPGSRFQVPGSRFQVPGRGALARTLRG